ncbi:hypothetical protein ACWKW4_04685 [Hydrogenophaga borbori]|uniref:hypothetical protein n=1 Tax=Hydrogenophaga borbori TaxID=2294117 RepID=UPI00301C8DDA
MNLSQADIDWFEMRSEVAAHCASFATELLDLLSLLPPGDPMEAVCLAGIEGAESALKKLGLRLAVE